MKHIIGSQDFGLQYISDLFEQTTKVKEILSDPHGKEKLRGRLRNKIIYSIFYQPSTRTRLSFETAARLLDATVLGSESAGEFSSAAKGEKLEHTIRVLCGYQADAIILRHKDDGAALRAKVVTDQHNFGTSIINAGDGTGQHPTQSLIDLYTIQDVLKRLDSFTIVIGGDLMHGRTTHSLAYLVSKYPNVKIIFVSPKELKIKSGIIDHLKEHEVQYEETESIEDAFPQADIVYWIRLQKECHESLQIPDSTYAGKYTITHKEMSLLKESAALLHPMPIVNEIDREVDNHPQAWYFRQSDNGLCLRIALLNGILSGEKF